ncbi:hypothetical protein ACYT7O_10755, partial [Streptococcus pyogenes]
NKSNARDVSAIFEKKKKTIIIKKKYLSRLLLFFSTAAAIRTKKKQPVSRLYSFSAESFVTCRDELS